VSLQGAPPLRSCRPPLPPPSQRRARLPSKPHCRPPDARGSWASTPLGCIKESCRRLYFAQSPELKSCPSWPQAARLLSRQSHLAALTPRVAALDPEPQPGRRLPFPEGSGPLVTRGRRHHPLPPPHALPPAATLPGLCVELPSPRARVSARPPLPLASGYLGPLPRNRPHTQPVRPAAWSSIRCRSWLTLPLPPAPCSRADNHARPAPHSQAVYSVPCCPACGVPCVRPGRRTHAAKTQPGPPPRGVVGVG